MGKITPSSDPDNAALPGNDPFVRSDLREAENEGVPSIDRSSDLAEAVADEKQDRVTSLNFPLHWSSARESWNYLFDFAIACELLAPRPDERILDLAAGTCWATEAMVRLGVRPVAIDLSLEMMRRGRERLECDSRLIYCREAGFVVGRGQALPFSDGSFDAVLCMNALHHLPSFEHGLREVHRVLADGGRAVFSEPGLAHAEQPLSQFRMREEGILEKSVSLDLIRTLAREVGFTRMKIVPLRSAQTYAIDYADDVKNATEIDRVLKDTVIHSAREHARFVLYKGDAPVADTLLPAAQLVGHLLAEISLLDVTPEVRSQATFTDRLSVTNRGSVVWRRIGRRFGGQVTIGLRICDLEGNVLREDLGRTWLPHDVDPGGQIEVGMTVTADLPPGRYTLRYDVVVEGVTWLESHGSPCPSRTLTVLNN